MAGVNVVGYHVVQCANILTALDELTFCSERLSGHLNVLAVACSVGSMRGPP